MAFTHIAHAKITSANPAVTAAMDTTAGGGASLLVAVCSRFTTFPASGELTDSASNTWLLRTGQASASNCNARVFYCIAPSTSATHTFTLTKSGDYPDVSVFAFHAGGTVTYNQESGAVNSSDAYTLAPGSLTLASGELAITGIGGYYVPNPDPPTVDSSFLPSPVVFTDNLAIGQNVMSASAYLIASGAGAVSPTWTFGSGGTFIKMAAVMATFLDSGGGGGGGRGVFRPAEPLGGVGIGGSFFKDPLQ
jgi:hypothetical protein